MNFKVGDVIRFSDPNDPELYGAIGTIHSMGTTRDGRISCICKNWSILFIDDTEWEAYEGEFELAHPYLQQQEAKKLLGIK